MAAAYKETHLPRCRNCRDADWADCCPKCRNRRGDYKSLTVGVSHGGGQPVRHRLDSAASILADNIQGPGNLQNTRRNAKVLLKLLRNPYIVRLAGFCSSK